MSALTIRQWERFSGTQTPRGRYDLDKQVTWEEFLRLSGISTQRFTHPMRPLQARMIWLDDEQYQLEISNGYGESRTSFPMTGRDLLWYPYVTRIIAYRVLPEMILQLGGDQRNLGPITDTARMAAYEKYQQQPFDSKGL